MFRRGDDDRREPMQQHEVANESAPNAGVRGQSSGSSSEVTVVGQGARLEGTLVSAGSLRIDGQIKGKIRAEGDVTLSGSSRVEADIEAQNVTVAGEFTGTILAKARAELASGGRVNGDVTSKTLVVAEGAVFTGQSIMGEQASARTSSGESARGGRAATPSDPPVEAEAPAKAGA